MRDPTAASCCWFSGAGTLVCQVSSRCTGGPIVSSTSTRVAFHVSEQVAAAVAGGRPVVALESTIFTHGLPRPRNLEVALEAEERLRSQGVVPATIGVFAGVPTVGLTLEQITSLSSDGAVRKVSLRDLPVAAALRLQGGTTVAATAFLAHRAGV